MRGSPDRCRGKERSKKCHIEKAHRGNIHNPCDADAVFSGHFFQNKRGYTVTGKQLAEYIHETGALLFIDDAHRLTGRKLQAARACVMSARVWLMSASQENRLAPNLGFEKKQKYKVQPSQAGRRRRMHRLVTGTLIGLLSGPLHAGLLDTFTGEKQAPPEVKPFELPTLTGEKVDYQGYMDPLEPAPVLDSDGIFRQAVNCYPEPTRFNVELNLEAGLRSVHGEQGVVTADNTTLGKEYIGIVASMPLFSASEQNRQREREYLRRTATSELIGRFLTAIAVRVNHARREITLYRALETRSQVRVKKGIVSTDEQVAYMEKLLGAHKTLIQAEITSARLAIAGQCADDKRPVLNDWLKRVSALPVLDPVTEPIGEKEASQ